MQALNQQERKSSFFSFILFYGFTTAVIILGIFFGTRVPIYQNKVMVKQIASFEKTKAISNNFSVKMNEVALLIDSVNKPTAQSNLIDGQINLKLTQLTAVLEADSTYAQEFHRQVLQMLYNQKDDKELLRLSANTASNNMEKDKIISELKSKITEYATALTNCQNQLIQLSR